MARRAPQSTAEHVALDGDVTLRCLVYNAGGAGPLVICAHGFPDCEESFREQVPALVKAGYRVVVPTMRGYAPSTRSATGRYDAASLGRDLIGLADFFSPGEPVRLFGHDWGAIAAYAAVSYAPHRVSHLAAAAVPHLRSAAAGFASLSQLRRSWYIGLFMFQLGRYAERQVLADDLALIDRLWRTWSPGYRCPPERMARIKDAIRPQLDAVLAYYRSLPSPRSLFGLSRRLLLMPTVVPALYLHGTDDGCIGVELVRGLEEAFVGELCVRRIPEAGHFVHLEQPQIVNRLLLEHFEPKR